ncbi:MAG: penicillin-insensitive murein endopeptidase [Vicinamibacteria bacterium]
MTSQRRAARAILATALLGQWLVPARAEGPQAPAPVPVACPVPGPRPAEPAAAAAPHTAGVAVQSDLSAPPTELAGVDSLDADDPDAFGPEPGLDAEAPADDVAGGVDAPLAASPVSLSIGTPDAGLLVNPVAMTEGPLWTLRDARETWGTAETIAYLRQAIEGVHRQFPATPRLVIGDISRADGGRLNRHASHQSGRDADVGYFYKAGAQTDFRAADARSLDVARTWALVRGLVTGTDVERIFIDRSLQRLLFAHALEQGEDRDWLDDIFGRRTAGKGAIIQHERRHRDHMHVRFYNPLAQDCGRLAYRELVASGLVPPPNVWHRVRRGETLSGLARRYGVSASAIRSANGLRGSFLRAGRRYAIPVRRVPAETAAVRVPPRRLPPAAEPAPADEASGSELQALREPPTRR